MPSAVPTARHSTPPTLSASQACSGSGGAPASSALRGPISESSARVLGHVLDLDLAADLVHLEVAAGGRQRLGLGVDQDLVVSQPQHPHIGLHVALAVEQRRVATLARSKRLDVVGQLPLQVLGRFAALKQQLAPARAIEQPALFAQLPVLGVELDCRRFGHRAILGSAGNGRPG